MNEQTHEPATLAVFREVVRERLRQDELWGEQNHAPAIWLMVLGEEVGEATRDALEAWVSGSEWAGATHTRLLRYRTELIQVAAVAVAMVESLDRNELATKHE